MTETRDEAFEAMAGRAAELERRVAELEAQLAAAESARVEAERDVREVLDSAGLIEPTTELGRLVDERTEALSNEAHENLRSAEAAEKRAEELEHKAEARLDCHAGPGTTEPACGGCISCLTRALEEAERQRDAWEAHKNEVVADWKRDVGLLSASQQREAGLQEAVGKFLADHASSAEFQSSGRTSVCGCAPCEFARAALAAHQGAREVLHYVAAPPVSQASETWVRTACGLNFNLEAIADHPLSLPASRLGLSYDLGTVTCSACRAAHQGAGAEPDLRAALADADRWILDQAAEMAKEVQPWPKVFDYACRECIESATAVVRGEGLRYSDDTVQPGFRCAVHAARKRAALSPAPAGTKGDHRG